jgi:hypothetical protein
MAILSFLRRRTLSRYADDKAVKDFARVAESVGLTEDERIDEAAAIIGKDEVTGADVERLGKLLGEP